MIAVCELYPGPALRTRRNVDRLFFHHLPPSLLRRPHPGIAFNEHYDGDGAIIYKHACALGCEGIVSTRRGSPYRAGRSDHWVKVKNPSAAPAVRRLNEEEWQ